MYEPFDYADGPLSFNGGALGTAGAWTATDGSIDWWNHPGGSTTGQVWDVGLDGINDGVDDRRNIFDGTYTNVAYSGGFAGAAAPGDRGLDEWLDQGTGNADANIGLDPSVTATFQSGTTTWMSWVTARAWDRNEGTPQVMLANTASSGGSRGASLNGGDGIGAGGGPSRFNLQDIYPQYFEFGVNNSVPGGYQNDANVANMGIFGGHNGEQIGFYAGGRQTATGELDEVGQPRTQTMPSARLDANGDFGDYNVVVVKIEWDADTNGEDIVSAVAFTSTDAVTEAAFDAYIAATPLLSSKNWQGFSGMLLDPITQQMVQFDYDANKPNLDQSTFNILNVQSLKFYIDEIRIAQDFSSVIGNFVPPFLLGDTNDDGTVDTLDIDPFVLLLTDPAGYAAAFPGVDPLAVGDINMDTVVDTLDIDPFVALLTAGSLNGGAVPEPGSIIMLGLAGVAGLTLVRRRK